MSDKATSKSWIEAGKILATDPKQTVACPECGGGTLVVHDEVFANDPSKMERYLTCSSCGATNIMRMRTPASS